jgi:hypothetical protein
MIKLEDLRRHRQEKTTLNYLILPVLAVLIIVVIVMQHPPLFKGPPESLFSEDLQIWFYRGIFLLIFLICLFNYSMMHVQHYKKTKEIRNAGWPV